LLKKDCEGKIVKERLRQRDRKTRIWLCGWVYNSAIFQKGGSMGYLTICPEIWNQTKPCPKHFPAIHSSEISERINDMWF